MEEKQQTQFPHQVAGKVTEAIRGQMNEANEKFGVTDGALVRMALASYMPGYLAAQGSMENIEFLATVGAAVEANPEIKSDLEKFLRNRVRKSRTAA